MPCPTCEEWTRCRFCGTATDFAFCLCRECFQEGRYLVEKQETQLEQYAGELEPKIKEKAA